MSYIPFKLERFFARHEFNCEHLMCASDCETLSIRELFELGSSSMNQLGDLRLGYTESQGSPELRVEISSLYDNVGSENIVVLSGAEEGIYIIMRTLLFPGDHIIVQTPCYQSLISIPGMSGVTVTKWVMDENKDWDLDLKFLRNSITPRTKMIIINFPHNPTGKIISQADYQEIIQIAKENQIILFSDEVYRFSEFNPVDQLPPAIDQYNMAISLGVMSKSFGLAGLRIGWLAINNNDLLITVSGYKDYTTICASAPSEQLSIIALKSKDKILARTLDIIQSNIALFDEFMIEFSKYFSWTKPKGSSIGFVRYKKGSTMEFCMEILREVGVLLLPSTEFDFNDCHFRIGFGRIDFQVGLEVFRGYMNKL